MTKRSLLAFLVLVLAAAVLAPSAALAEPAECNDAIDNDADGLTDYPNDPGCLDATDDTEIDPVPECSDGIDNDNDGQIDFPEDTSCASDHDGAERTTCNDTGSPSRCVATNVTFRWDRERRAFVGGTGHNLRACIEGREVVVYRQRPGRDEALGSVLTNGRGNWRLDTWRRPRGVFHAKVPRHVVVARDGGEIVCKRDRSVTIRLRG